jgi:hypothetical protein
MSNIIPSKVIRRYPSTTLWLAILVTIVALLLLAGVR